jgi:hypothetical protein
MGCSIFGQEPLWEAQEEVVTNLKNELVKLL